MPVLDQTFKFSQDLDGSKLERNPIHKESPLGPLSLLKGKWTGRGFNVIWRPDSLAGQDRFLELNLTNETITFEEIPGAIPNRGLLQPDIDMFGLHYLQQISDLNTKAGLHVEPGIWASVPKTEDPAEAPSVVRMASIPHGTTILAQGPFSSMDPPRSSPSTSPRSSSDLRRKRRSHFRSRTSRFPPTSGRHRPTCKASRRPW